MSLARDLLPTTAQWAWLVAGAVALWLGFSLLARALGRRTRRKRLAHAQRGERDAAELLRSLGYDIVDRQAPGSLTLEVDGRRTQLSLRADYVVKRGGKRLVAEVKTGSRAPRLSTASTRRQLLEYQIAYDADAALLVDMELGEVRTVRFPTKQRSATRGWVIVAAAMAAALLLSLWLRD